MTEFLRQKKADADLSEPQWYTETGWQAQTALGDAGEDSAIATYVVNSCDLQDIRDKCDLYYPRFLKLRLQRDQVFPRH